MIYLLELSRTWDVLITDACVRITFRSDSQESYEYQHDGTHEGLAAAVKRAWLGEKSS